MTDYEGRESGIGEPIELMRGGPVSKSLGHRAMQVSGRIEGANLIGLEGGWSSDYLEGIFTDFTTKVIKLEKPTTS